MTTRSTPIAWQVLAGACAVFAACAPAQAEDHERGLTLTALPLYKQECAACHTAYPPGLLPAVSWQRLMANLPRHFGADASLEPGAARDIGTWLTAHAGTYRGTTTPPPGDRITQQPWFIREHREVPATSWKLPAVKTAANCAACHRQADQGDFNEHSVRTPR